MAEMVADLMMQAQVRPRSGTNRMNGRTPEPTTHRKLAVASVDQISGPRPFFIGHQEHTAYERYGRGGNYRAEQSSPASDELTQVDLTGPHEVFSMMSDLKVFCSGRLSIPRPANRA